MLFADEDGRLVQVELSNAAEVLDPCAIDPHTLSPSVASALVLRLFQGYQDALHIANGEYRVLASPCNVRKKRPACMRGTTSTGRCNGFGELGRQRMNETGSDTGHESGNKDETGNATSSPSAATAALSFALRTR